MIGKNIFLFMFLRMVAAKIMLDPDKGVFSAAILAGHASQDSGSLPDYKTLCPYSSFCKSPPLKVNKNESLVSCCEKCSCDVKCYEVGNCCPDVPYSQARNVKYPCTKVSVVDDNLNYHVVNDCRNATIATIYPQCLVPAELDDLVFVSSPDNGRVYKNKHCAMCNDVTNYVTWNLHVGCTDILKMAFLTKKERDGFIFQNQNRCLVYSVPPRSGIEEMGRCFLERNVITSCNVTAHWDYYDKYIEQACHNTRVDQNLIFVENSLRTILRYANVYCYLCNSKKQTKKYDLCEATDFNTEIKNFFPRFTAILDLDVSEDVDVEDNTCQRNEIWDPFSNLCRGVQCPAGTVPSYGQCRGILMYSDYYTIHVSVAVSIGNKSQLIDYNRLLYHVSRKIVSRFAPGCAVGDIFLYDVRNSTFLLISFDLSSTRLCSVDFIMNVLHKMATSPPIVMLYTGGNKENYNITLRLVTGKVSIDQSFEELAIINSKLEYYVSSYTHIETSILLYCPAVTLTRTEFLSFGLHMNIGVISHVELLGNEIDNTIQNNMIKNNNTQTYVVCAETYFQARRPGLVSDSSRLFDHTLAYIVLVIGSCVIYI